jgi:hypothetical protein
MAVCAHVACSAPVVSADAVLRIEGTSACRARARAFRCEGLLIDGFLLTGVPR